LAFPTFALPIKLAFSSTINRGASMSHPACNPPEARSVQSRKHCPPSSLAPYRFRRDLTAYACVFTERERSGGIDSALHLAIDAQFVEKFDQTLDRNSSG
jgi:hypothetical protein